MKTKLIAYTAVLSALAVVVTTLVHYLIPAKTVPLALVSLIGIVAFRLTGWGGGIAFVAVTALLTFVFTGLSITFFTLVVLFLPYAILAHALKKLRYTDKTVLIRAPLAYVYFYFSSFALMSLAICLASAQSALYEIQEKIGIWLTSAVFALACMPADFFLSAVADVVVQRLDKTKKR